MRAVVAVVALFISSWVFSAPDEEILGKSQGYPVCTLSQYAAPAHNQQCIIGTLSRFDEIVPFHKVAKGASTYPLRRAASEPEFRYKGFVAQGTVEDFLAKTRATGLLVMQGDTILVERYQYERKPEHRFTSMSMAKTVVAMLIGISLQEGLIKSIDDKAEQYVPELKGHPYGETSLRHLLTMSSGVKFVEVYNGQDDVSRLGRGTLFQQGPGGAASVALFRVRERPAGEKFHYSSAETYVLGLVLRAAVGKSLADYLSEKIWQPMGAEADATWLVDKSGQELSFVGINATLRDWGRLGLLLAHDGALGGTQIIPAAWVRAATIPDADHLKFGIAGPRHGYGYQTWLLPGNRRAFALLGFRGQAVMVDPTTKTVVVHTGAHWGAGDPARSDQFQLFYAVVRQIENKQ